MTTDYLKKGSTLNINVSALDADGALVDLTGYTAAMRICRDCVGGTTTADVELSITDNVITGSYDTESLEPNDFYYDIRMTDEAGNDYFSDPVKMVIMSTNTPAS